MGLDHNAYVGPYVRVTKTITKGQGDHCKDHNRGDAAFCPQCGKSKKDRIYTFEDNGAPDDWEEEYEKGSFYDYLTSTSFMSAPILLMANEYISTCLIVTIRN